MDTSTPYQPPDYLVASTGLTARQLRTQFEGFKRTLRFAPSAPELVFERVAANLFALSPPLQGPAEASDEFKQSLDDLRDEIASLSNSLLDVKNSLEFSKGCLPDPTIGAPSLATRTPIEFTFVLGPYGVSTRSEPYHSNDGRYGTGCLWSDLDVDDRHVQFGTYNTIDDWKSEPQSQQSQPEIKFATRFREIPEVVVWLTGIDMKCERPCHVKLSPVEISETGFEVHITSSEDCVWYSLGFSWVAWPEEEGKYSCSWFDTVLYGRLAEPEGMLHYKVHRLPIEFGEPKKIILAVHGLAMARGGTMPFLLEQAFPAKDGHLCYDVTTALAATGMYILHVVCITCT